MTKQELLTVIIATLEADLALFFSAAKTAHAAATHAECLPDNKYDTTALEASYIAQGQANRAQEIRLALEYYRNLTLQEFDDNTTIRLTALITLEDEAGAQRRLFLGPASGGLKVKDGGSEVVVITPGSPLGRGLLGKQTGDEVQADEQVTSATFVIVAVV
jgi:transcription elongation GreA/GreB family factor